jgi:hypothetical protein
MGSNDVVSIRVEALGVSITIADGSIAIEQRKTEIPAVSAVPKVESPAAATSETVPVRTVTPDAETDLIDELEQTLAPPPSPGRNGLTAADSRQTKWNDEEIEKLKALYPTHSVRAIATQLGRGFLCVRSKAQNLGLKKPASPREKSAPKPRSLSAAVTVDSPSARDQNGGPAFSSVSLLDHHPGQCRWIVSDVWPVMYCGAPVVDDSSWCEQHFTRVFNLQPHGLGTSPHRIRYRPLASGILKA